MEVDQMSTLKIGPAERHSAPAARKKMGRFARLGVVAALASTLITGAGLATAKPAEAMSASCGSGRCTVYLTKGETWSLGYGAVPAPPASTPWQLRSAYYAMAYGHRWFAQQYANRGMCSGLRLSMYPWESQGYFGYYC
jgi:hypothetical protein